MNAPWTKASRSGGNGGECVEVRQHDGTVQVQAFVDGLTEGEFDR